MEQFRFAEERIIYTVAIPSCNAQVEAIFQLKYQRHVEAGSETEWDLKGGLQHYTSCADTPRRARRVGYLPP